MQNGYFGVMLDCSRNGVIKVEKVKEFINVISKFGYNALELYTEDTYQVDNEPYFGYMRGGYSKADIKEIDSYAKSKGVELIPCIQTLAHLSSIFRWKEYSDINDAEDILLIGEEHTYKLIENMFATLSECFSSRVVNVGMDEAEMVGRGKYQTKHGYEDKFQILKKHLERVIEIAQKYGFKPIMWSDMFFKMYADLQNSQGNVTTGKYNLPSYSKVPKEIAQAVPNGVGLTYWNYYQDKDVLYSKMLKIHKLLDNDCWFAGGAWTWMGYAPNNRWSLCHLKPAMKACKNQGVKNVLITVWGDNGQECSHFAILPALFYAIKTYNGETNLTKIKKEFKEITGEDFNAFLALDLPNVIADNKTARPFNPSKYGLYSDLINGYTDLYVPEGAGLEYAKHAKKLNRLAKTSKNYGYIFDTLAKLCQVLSVKFELGKRLRIAYKNKDKLALSQIVLDIKRVELKLNGFEKSLYTRWHTDCNPHGYDVLDIRIGGLKQRLKTARLRITEYLENKVESIPELETELLPTIAWEDSLLSLNNWAATVSVNRL